MAKWQVLIYDGNDGQVRAGLGPFEQWSKWKRESLLSQDAAAQSKVYAMEDFFAGLDVEWREVATYEQASEQITQADFLLVFKGTVDRELLARAEKLREVHVLGADTRTVDVEALKSRNIPLIQVPVTNFLAVAEHAVALILALNKRLRAASAAMQMGGYWMGIPGNVRLMRNLTIGLLGVGEIGYETGRLLQPFGVKLLYHDLQPHDSFEQETGATYVGWQELFAKSDVVSVHLPLNERTEKRIGRQEFAWMQPHALFINTARGELVDEQALLFALQNGQIGGAGLDVFAQEPLDKESPFHLLDNVLLTPHMGWGGPWTLVNDANRLLGGVAEAIRKWEASERAEQENAVI